MEKYNEHSIIKPIEMFPKWMDHINRELPIWNFEEENFFVVKNLYEFIIWALTKWISEDILKYWSDYLWKQTVLDAFEFYKDIVSDDFREKVKNILENI